MRYGFRLTFLAIALAQPFAAGAQDVPNKAARTIVEKIQPAYPELARRNGLTGTVKLKVVIAPNGRAEKVDVVGGNPVFLENATATVRKWKWSTADHESVEVVEIKFGSGT